MGRLFFRLKFGCPFFIQTKRVSFFLLELLLNLLLFLFLRIRQLHVCKERVERVYMLCSIRHGGKVSLFIAPFGMGVAVGGVSFFRCSFVGLPNLVRRG